MPSGWDSLSSVEADLGLLRLAPAHLLQNRGYVVNLPGLFPNGVLLIPAETVKRL